MKLQRDGSHDGKEDMMAYRKGMVGSKSRNQGKNKWWDQTISL